MAELEARLGARLIARTTRKLRLTEAGVACQASVTTALSVLDEGAEFVHAVTAVPRGLVRVAVPVNFGYLFMSPLLPRFVERYPDVHVDALFSDSYIDPVRDGFDVVIRDAAHLPDSTLVARKFMETPVVVCASPDYIDRCGAPTRPNDLTNYECLPLTGVTITTDWIFDVDGAERSITVNGPIRSSSIMIAHQAAIAGTGIARLPYHFVAADIEAGRLVRLLHDFEHAENSLFLTYPAQRTLALKTRVFIDFLISEIGSLVA